MGLNFERRPGRQAQILNDGRNSRYTAQKIYYWNNRWLVVNWVGDVACGAVHILVLLSSTLEAFLCRSLGDDHIWYL